MGSIVGTKDCSFVYLIKRARRIENKHTTDLAVIYQKREDELKAITQKAADARLKINQDTNARMEAENKRTQPQTPSEAPNLQAPQFRIGFGGMMIPVPPLAEGGLVSQPTPCVNWRIRT